MSCQNVTLVLRIRSQLLGKSFFFERGTHSSIKYCIFRKNKTTVPFWWNSKNFLFFCVSISFNFPQVKESFFYFIWNHFLFDVSSPSFAVFILAAAAVVLFSWLSFKITKQKKIVSRLNELPV